MLLAVVEKILGDIPSDVVRSAVDGTLEILKQDTVKDMDKKEQLESLLSAGLSNEEFSNLLALSKKITDYHSTTEEKDQGPDEHGVAVLFDEDEESDEMEEVQDVQDIQEDDEEKQVLKSVNSKTVDQGIYYSLKFRGRRAR
jgi:pre-mRNA-splicing helicase BRR2